MAKITVNITNIDWDVDDEGDLYRLPKSVCYTFEREEFDCGDNELEEEIEETVADKLSDDHEYCHNGFNIKISYDK